VIPLASGIEPQPGQAATRNLRHRFQKFYPPGQDYEADRDRRLGADANAPQRIKYWKLTR
jgi:hypothetical protein